MYLCSLCHSVGAICQKLDYAHRRWPTDCICLEVHPRYMPSIYACLDPFMTVCPRVDGVCSVSIENGPWRTDLLSAVPRSRPHTSRPSLSSKSRSLFREEGNFLSQINHKCLSSKCTYSCSSSFMTWYRVTYNPASYPDMLVRVVHMDQKENSVYVWDGHLISLNSFSMCCVHVYNRYGGYDLRYRCRCGMQVCTSRLPQPAVTR